MVKFLILISFIITSSIVCAQSNDEFVLGTCSQDLGRDIVIDPHGNKYILSHLPFGYRTYSTITKLSPSNNIIWSKGFMQSVPSYHVEANTLELFNNSLIITGRTFNMNTTVTGNTLFISKIDTSGTLDWTNIYNTGRAHSLVVKDDRFYVTGEAYEGVEKYFFVMSADTIGNVLWNKKFHHNEHSGGSDIKSTSDGNLIATGYFELDNTIANNAVGAVKLDTAGNVLWKNYYLLYDDSLNYRIPGGIYTHVIESDYDSSYFIQGTHNISSEISHTFLLNLNPNDGQVISNLSYDFSPVSEASISVELINTNNGYAVVGQDRWGVLDNDIIAMALDYSGNPIWARSYGDTSNNKSAAIIKTATGFSIVGTTEDFYPLNYTYEDAYYFELDNIGMAPNVLDTALNITVGTIPTVPYSNIIESDYTTSIESITLIDTIVNGFVNPQLCPFVDVNEIELDGSFIVFPNPANTYISAIIPENESLKSLILMNNQGKKIRALLDGESELKIDQLPSGTYFLRITTESKSVIRRVVVN